MKTELTIVAMTLMLLTGALGQTSTGTVAGLPAELRNAVLRDAACSQADHPSPPKPAGLPSQLANTGQAGPAVETPTAEPASSEAAPANLLETAVGTQDIRSGVGANVGVIVRFSDACHCRETNCSTYVFLRSDAGFKLAFSGGFLSLHPVRVYKRGYPSLSGKVQLSKAQAESTVYDWNGKAYAPSLCATITQATGRKAPGIVHHDCAKSP